MIDNILGIIIVGAAAYGLAWLLNTAMFNKSPAPSWGAWLLSLVVVIASFFGLFFAQVLTRGGGARPNFFMPFLIAWLFFAALKRKKPSAVAPASEPNVVSTEHVKADQPEKNA
jgi:H+/Cl- antiporter ClcA